VLKHRIVPSAEPALLIMLMAPFMAVGTLVRRKLLDAAIGPAVVSKFTALIAFFGGMRRLQIRMLAGFSSTGSKRAITDFDVLYSASSTLIQFPQRFSRANLLMTIV